MGYLIDTCIWIDVESGTLAAAGRKTCELIQYVTDRPGHDRRYAIDPTKLKKQLRFDIESNFGKMLNEALAWFFNNEQWWRPLLQKHSQNRV